MGVGAGGGLAGAGVRGYGRGGVSPGRVGVVQIRRKLACALALSGVRLVSILNVLGVCPVRHCVSAFRGRETLLRKVVLASEGKEGVGKDRRLVCGGEVRKRVKWCEG